MLIGEILKNVRDDESIFEAFDDYIAVIRDYNKNQEIKRLKEMINEEVDPEKKASLLERIRLVKMWSEESD